EHCARTMRCLSLHGMSRDGWSRFRAGGSWDYEIHAPGFKYNMTDVAAALGLQQLRRANRFHARRAHIAARYTAGLADLDAIETPQEREDRQHSWHLYPIRLHAERMTRDRGQFIQE